MPLKDVQLGPNVVIHHPELVNLYGCQIGAHTKIGTFVEVQKNAEIGQHCKISSHSFVCEGVTIGDDVFVGHGVLFINDLWPRAKNEDGSQQEDEDWEVIPTHVEDGASIGTGAVIMGGVTIGKNAMIGAGAVVTKDISPGSTVAGVPARLLRTSSQAPDLSGHG